MLGNAEYQLEIYSVRKLRNSIRIQGESVRILGNNVRKFGNLVRKSVRKVGSWEIAEFVGKFGISVRKLGGRVRN